MKDKIEKTIKEHLFLDERLYDLKWIEESYKLNIVLHFPRYKITDGRNFHTIRDLFIMVRILAEAEGFYLMRTDGFRTTYTLAEYQSGYSHSHLSGIKLPGAADAFCMGSNTEIRKLHDKLRNGKYSYELLDMYVSLLDSLARWESIEGTPYRNIKNIKHNNSTSKLARDLHTDAYNYLISNKDDFSYSIYQDSSNSFKVEVKDIEELFNKLKPSYKNDLFVVEEDGKYYSTVNTNKVDTSICGMLDTEFVFKNKTYVTTVLKDVKVNDIKRERIPNPITIKNLNDKLSSEFTKFLKETSKKVMIKQKKQLI